MKIVLSMLFNCLILYSSLAQLQGKVVYDQYGLEFTIPENWFGQEGDDGIYLSSNTTPGIVILSVHNYTKGQLVQNAKTGLSEADGTYLQLTGSLEQLNDVSVGGLFEGTIGYERAKAYIVGIGAEGKQFGVSIISAANSSVYTKANKEVALALFASFKFKEKSAASEASTSELQEWIDWLKNVRLVYMDSYYSSGSVGGGYSSEERIDLCGKGYFNFSSSNEMTVSGSGTSGYSQGGDAGNGVWEIIKGLNGPVLHLKYYDGRLTSYDLEYTDNKLYLNGYRYFRITEGDERPNCY